MNRIIPFDISGDGRVFVVMDANCLLCAMGARWIAHNDRHDVFRIVPADSALGASLLRRQGLDELDPESWLLIDAVGAHQSLDALMRAGVHLGGLWQVLGVLQLLPRCWRDWLYHVAARNRYRLFGKADMCRMPDPAIRRRLVQ
ncbi:MAG: DCC1-like thiol-disulfide oxidoreductase family protein [Paracoccaceae bacterium]|nr:DCC1-like thiol-disulfide oxidoreductase family protein [Paracoccaceae bacterium]